MQRLNQISDELLFYKIKIMFITFKVGISFEFLMQFLIEFLSDFNGTKKKAPLNVVMGEIEWIERSVEKK